MARKTTKRTASKSPLPPAPPVEVAKVVPARRYTFRQWANLRSVQAHHQSGLRAFCTNPHAPRTLDEWDACFKDY